MEKRLKEAESGNGNQRGFNAQRTQLLTTIDNLTRERNYFENMTRENNVEMEKLSKQAIDAEAARKEMATHIVTLQMNFAEQIESYENRLQQSRKQNFVTPLNSIHNLLNSNEKNLQKLSLDFLKELKEQRELFSNQQRKDQELQRASSELIEFLTNFRNQFFTKEGGGSLEFDQNTKINEITKNYQRQINELKRAQNQEIQMLQDRICHEVQLKENSEAQLEQFKMAASSQTGFNSLQNNVQATNNEYIDPTRQLEEIRMRQQLEEEKRELEMKLNELQTLETEVNAMKEQHNIEKQRLIDELLENRDRFQENMQRLTEQLNEADKHRTNLENTKSALESTIEMLMLNSGNQNQPAIDNSTTELMLQAERNRSRLEIEELEGKIVNLENKLKEAEQRELSNASMDTSLDIQQIKSIMEKELQKAHQENAILSSQVEVLRAQLQAIQMQPDYETHYDDNQSNDYQSQPLYSSTPSYSNPSSHSTFTPLPPPGPPPPLPPPGVAPPPPPPFSSPSSSNASFLSEISNPGNKLRSRGDIPTAEVSTPSRNDLLESIRAKNVALKPVDQNRGNEEVQVSDPQNVLQVLAKVLSARRGDIEDDDNGDDDDDELWEA